MRLAPYGRLAVFRSLVGFERGRSQTDRPRSAPGDGTLGIGRTEESVL